MSQEAVRRSIEHEDGEIVETRSPGNMSHNGDSEVSERSFQVKTPNKKRRSKYDELEDKFNKKFDSVDSKLDRLVTLFSSKSSPSPSVHRDENSGDELDDILSIRDIDDKIYESDTDSESVQESTKKCLVDIFGEDAKISSEEKQIGISIDNSQKEVLKNGYRTSSPTFLTSYSESLIDKFPMDKDTETFLQVPPIDPLIESCLIKRHGSKAAFSSSKTRGKGLYSQPSKMVERIAYKGSHAARLGIIIQMYIQQSLGGLLETIQSSTLDKEKAEKQVKDIFSMATKGLDQIGRSGAFHHIIRRSVAMTDTALYELSDSNKFQNLPLTGDGLFGSELEQLLKTRKEQKKQIEELVPDIGKKDMKRKSYPSSSGKEVTNKRQCFDKPTSTDSSASSFRIPRVPRSGTQYERRPGFKPSSGATTSDGYSRPSYRGRGRGNKK